MLVFSLSDCDFRNLNSSNVTFSYPCTWCFACWMVTEQDVSQGQVGDTDLPNAGMKVVLQFMLQDIAFSHLQILVNVFHFDRNLLC